MLAGGDAGAHFAVGQAIAGHCALEQLHRDLLRWALFGLPSGLLDNS